MNSDSDTELLWRLVASQRPDGSLSGVLEQSSWSGRSSEYAGPHARAIYLKGSEHPPIYQVEFHGNLIELTPELQALIAKAQRLTLSLSSAETVKALMSVANPERRIRLDRCELPPEISQSWWRVLDIVGCYSSQPGPIILNAGTLDMNLPMPEGEWRLFSRGKHIFIRGTELGGSDQAAGFIRSLQEPKPKDISVNDVCIGADFFKAAFEIQARSIHCQTTEWHSKDDHCVLPINHALLDLKLDGAYVHQRMLEELVRKSPRLKTLGFTSGRLTESLCRSLAEHGTLESLDIEGMAIYYNLWASVSKAIEKVQVPSVKDVSVSRRLRRHVPLLQRTFPNAEVSVDLSR